MFFKILVFSVSIYTAFHLTTATKNFEKLNELVTRMYQQLSTNYFPKLVMDQNEQEYDLSELLNPYSSIVTENDYKEKIPCFHKVLSAVYASHLENVIGEISVFWNICKIVDRHKNTLQGILSSNLSVFKKVLNSLKFFNQFLDGPALKNDVHTAVRCLIHLSNDFKKSVECITVELNTAMSSVQNFQTKYFRPAPSFISDSTRFTYMTGIQEINFDGRFDEISEMICKRINYNIGQIDNIYTIFGFSEFLPFQEANNGVRLDPQGKYSAFNINI